MPNWYILCSFGTFFLVLVSRAKKNLETLMSTAPRLQGGFPDILFSPRIERN
jgi:hypothetical protein